MKRILEKAKGSKEWGDFLLELYTEARRLKKEGAFRELAEMLSENDLENIARSSEEFREGFALR